MIGDTGESLGEPGLRVEVVRLGGDDQGADHRGDRVNRPQRASRPASTRRPRSPGLARVAPVDAVEQMAAIDRLVPILEMNGNIYRRRAAEDRLAHGADAAAAADDDKLANSDNLQPADNISDNTKEDVTA